MSKFFVYELWCPFDGIFYVGKGSGNRAYAHERVAMNNVSDTHKDRKIRKIKSMGGTIEIRYVLHTDDPEIATAKEIELILHYGRHDLTTGPLLNHTAGGDGGDTTRGVTPELLHDRYTRRLHTLANKSEHEKTAIRIKHSDGLKRTWSENYETRREAIRNGIRHNRDRDSHAAAISAGWYARSPEDKLATSLKRSASRKHLLNDPVYAEKHTNFIKAGNKASSLPIKVVRPNGQIDYAVSVSEWCRNFCSNLNLNHGSTHNTLVKIANGWKPKYKTNFWNGWSVEFSNLT